MIIITLPARERELGVVEGGGQDIWHWSGSGVWPGLVWCVAWPGLVCGLVWSGMWPGKGLW